MEWWRVARKLVAPIVTVENPDRKVCFSQKCGEAMIAGNLCFACLVSQQMKTKTSYTRKHNSTKYLYKTRVRLPPGPLTLSVPKNWSRVINLIFNGGYKIPDGVISLTLRLTGHRKEWET